MTPRIHPGQTVENPVAGVRFTFTDTAASTGGGMTQRGLPRNLLDLALLARTYDAEAHAPGRDVPRPATA
jgi:hypothetical protein